MQTSNDELIWQRLHGAALLFGMFRVIRGGIVTIVFLLFWARNSGRGTLIFLGALGTLFLGIPFIGEVLRFISFRYSLEGGNITIREGIFSRKIRRIPVKRIHNINTRQGIFARLFRVVRVDIETAGGSGTEASLIAVSLAEAERVQAYVREEKALARVALDEKGSELEDQPHAEPLTREIYRISMKDIFIAGATTYRMGIIFVALYAVWDYSEELIKGSELFGWVENGIHQLEEVRKTAGMNILLIGALIFFLLFFSAWLLSIGSALIRWYRFTLTESDEDLHISCGLFTLRSYTIPLVKIQALRCTTSLFRRPLGLMQINVTSAGHVGIQEKEKAESDLLVPITHKRRTEIFVQAIWPKAGWQAVNWRKVHPYTRLHHFRILMTIFMSILLGLQLFVWRSSWPLFVLVLGGLAILAFVIADLTYRQIGYAHDENFAYLKTGFLGLQYWVIPISKIQNLALTQTPFQRIRNLASLQIDVAGQGMNEAKIPNIELATCWRLFNRFGHPQGYRPQLVANLSTVEN